MVSKCWCGENPIISEFNRSFLKLNASSNSAHVIVPLSHTLCGFGELCINIKGYVICERIYNSVHISCYSGLMGSSFFFIYICSWACEIFLADSNSFVQNTLCNMYDSSNITKIGAVNLWVQFPCVFSFRCVEILNQGRLIICTLSFTNISYN